MPVYRRTETSLGCPPSPQSNPGRSRRRTATAPGRDNGRRLAECRDSQTGGATALYEHDPERFRDAVTGAGMSLRRVDRAECDRATWETRSSLRGRVNEAGRLAGSGRRAALPRRAGLDAEKNGWGATQGRVARAASRTTKMVPRGCALPKLSTQKMNEPGAIQLPQARLRSRLLEEKFRSGGPYFFAFFFFDFLKPTLPALGS